MLSFLALAKQVATDLESTAKEENLVVDLEKESGDAQE